MSSLERRVGALERHRAMDMPAINTIVVWQHGAEPPLDGEENKGAAHMKKFHLEDSQRATCYLEVKDFQEGRFCCHLCEYRESYEPTATHKTPGG